MAIPIKIRALGAFAIVLFAALALLGCKEVPGADGRYANDPMTLKRISP
jgi:hypothetical protein